MRAGVRARSDGPECGPGVRGRAKSSGGRLSPRLSSIPSEGKSNQRHVGQRHVGEGASRRVVSLFSTEPTFPLLLFFPLKIRR